jgi:ribonuclease BN (tRNA processing enzyme)
LARRLALHVPRDAGPVALAHLDAALSARAQPSGRFDAAFIVAEYAAGEQLAIGALRLTFAPTDHEQPCFAVRVTDGRSVVVYGADGGPSAEVAAMATGADLLVLEATFVDDGEAAAAHRHMTAEQAGELAAEAAVHRLVLTHLLPGAPRAQLLAAAARAYRGPIDVADEAYAWQAAIGGVASATG